jgi:hypothetical protein
MGKACGELDVQTGRFNNIPTAEIQYCQNFMIQVEQSTFDKIAAKEVDWSFSDIEEDGIYDMRLSQENTYLWGVKRVIHHVTKDGMATWFTGGIWWMAGQDITVGHWDVTAGKAVISDETGAQKCAGHGSESKRDFGDFIEKAETKAVGRALAMLGYGTQFTAAEFDEGERIVDSPVDRMPRGSAEAAQEAGDRKLKEIEQQMKQARESDPASPVRSTATDEQIAFIRENADGKTLKSAMEAFGPNMEKMTQAQANKLIARINGGAA